MVEQLISIELPCLQGKEFPVAPAYSQRMALKLAGVACYYCLHLLADLFSSMSLGCLCSFAASKQL